MRFIIYGAGGIGMLTGARLHQAGYKTILIARPDNVNAMRNHGLTIRTGHNNETVHVDCFPNLNEIKPLPHDIILLCVKTHQTKTALNELLQVFPHTTPVACLQNGLENEELVHTHFKFVVSAVVIVFGMYLKAGEVDSGCWQAPTGYYEFGSYSTLPDNLLDELSKAFTAADFIVHLPSNIRESQYAKLLINLCNAVPAITNCKTSPQMAERIIKEGETVLKSSGIPFESAQSLLNRFKKLTGKPFIFTLADGSPYLGSTWQSLILQKSHVETPFFNGVIEKLGKKSHIPTPFNTMLNKIVCDMADKRELPGLYTEAQLLEMINENS